jgi:hypothetical protein
MSCLAIRQTLPRICRYKCPIYKRLLELGTELVELNHGFSLPGRRKNAQFFPSGLGHQKPKDRAIRKIIEPKTSEAK